MLVELLTRDGFKVEVDDVVWAECTTLKNLVEDIDDHDKTLPLPNITRATLVPLIDFHNGRAACFNEASAEAWERDFLSKFTPIEMCELMVAANYLAAERFISALASSIASSISGKSPGEIREMLNITNDFTPEEEARIISDVAWALV
jgi:S-phase kinase-associated protein 1